MLLLRFGWETGTDGARGILANHLTEPGKLAETLVNRVPRRQPRNYGWGPDSFLFAPAITTEQAHNFSLGLRTVTQFLPSPRQIYRGLDSKALLLPLILKIRARRG